MRDMTPGDGLVRVFVSAGPADGLGWADGTEVVVPAAAFVRAGIARPESGARVSAGELAGLLNGDDVEDLRTRAAFTESPPASSRLPVSYQRVPPAVRSAAASLLGRWSRRGQARWAAFPLYPLDLSSDAAADASSASSLRIGPPTPVLLSHDLDSLEGLRNVVERFVDMEESFGARSSNYVVPCSWPLDRGLLAELKARGHEVGAHGFDHSNRTAFASADERRERLARAHDALAEFDPAGYRAPSLLRTRGLLEDVGLYFRYDSSIPTSGGLFPVPNNGCASARPFRVGQLPELPLSLPRDGSLLFLGHSPEEILAIWVRCAERIADSGGVVVLLTHCEDRFSGTARMLDVYRRFLAHIAASPRFRWSTPHEVLGLSPSLPTEE